MDENYATLWEHIADAVPDHPALVQGERRLSWQAFDDRAARLAAAFEALGAGPDSKIAFYLYNGNEYIEATFATFKARAVPVNVNYRYLEDELSYLLDNSDAEVLLFHGSLADRVSNVRDGAPHLKAVVQVDDGSPLLEGAHAYEDLIAAHDPAPRTERRGDDLYFLYTGGTTGMPKAVMWRHADLFDSTMPTAYLLRGKAAPETPSGVAEIAKELVDAHEANVHLPASPLMHGTGFITTCQTLTAGGTIVTLENRSFDAHELWQVVEREGVTQMAIVGDAFAKPMLRALEEAESEGRHYEISSVGLIVSSGVMWTAAVKQALLERGGMILYDALSASEGIGFATQITMPGSDVKTAKFAVGANTKVFTEEGEEIEPGSGQVGMLAVGGAIPLGYYKDESKSAQTFREFGGQRWSIPGDFATVEVDGTVNLLGRGSVCINTGGEKVYPEEVEEAVKTHGSVLDCTVVGVSDEKWGEAVTAVVSLRSGVTATEGDLRQAVKAHLADFKAPKHYVMVDEIARGPSGKADYKWAKSVAEKELAGR